MTSTTIAQAAASVYRQGYTDDAEVAGILKGVTKFGAVSDLSTDEALDTMTASMQNFRREGESAQQVVERIGDTWSYMGDAVATEGADVAEAMGKASASVKSVGLEFERSSAYAAILLAKTQQAGQVIGTQLNSLASRYGKITSKGFKSITSDDEGEALSFNDISKALKEAGIEMYDAATKTFMPLGDVLDELAPKWNTLDEATQKYIATAMGSTRGMNYFLTLMENYDDALALEREALDNRGVVESKYQTWLEGVEAAQNNLKNSAEELYSILKADTLVSAYNGLAGLVDTFTAGTEAVGGLNLKLPLLVSGIMLIISAVAKLKTIITSFGKANFLSTFLSPSGFGAVVAAIAAVVSIVGVLASSWNTAEKEAQEYQELIGKEKSKADSYKQLQTELEELSGKTELTAAETERFNQIRQELIALSPSLASQFDMEKEGLAGVAEAANLAAEGYKNATDAMNEFAVASLQSNIESGNKKIQNIMKGTGVLGNFWNESSYDTFEDAMKH